MTNTPDGGSAAPSRSGSTTRIIAAVVLILAGIGICVWNEGNAQRRGSALDEAQRAAVPMPSIDSVDPAFDGKLVLASGRATPAQNVVDPLFDLTVPPPVLVLRREVEYFQWHERKNTTTTKAADGSSKTSTSYTYTPEWTKKLINSRSFHTPQGHDNTLRLTPGVEHQMEDAVFYSPQVAFGAYLLPDFLLKILGENAKARENFAPPFTEVQLGELRRKLLRPDGSLGAAIGRAAIDKVAGAVTDALGGHTGNVVLGALEGGGRAVPMEDGSLFLGADPAAPMPGDVRVRWYATPATDVTILAQVTGNTFQRFATASGQNVTELVLGRIDMNEMFKQAASSGSLVTWLLRIVGVGLALAGIYSIATRKRAA